MQGVAQPSALRWAVLPVQPVEDPNVQPDTATSKQLGHLRDMKLFATTACAMMLGISMSAAQTQTTPGNDNAANQTPAAAPSDPIAPGGHWNVAAAQCRALLGESDDDRAAIGMFYYGYLSAKLNFNIIDTSRIENDLRHVFETCHQHPDMTIVAAFRTLRQKNH
jgi:hypothetical protein